MPVYFLTVFLVFWVPGIALMVALYRFLGPAPRKSFWITCLIMAVVSFGMEYVYLWADIWNFSEAHDPLLGIRIWGAPIEEFTYWFGATPFCLSLYLLFQRLPFAGGSPPAPVRVRTRRKRSRRRRR